MTKVRIIIIITCQRIRHREPPPVRRVSNLLWLKYRKSSFSTMTIFNRLRNRLLELDPSFPPPPPRRFATGWGVFFLSPRNDVKRFRPWVFARYATSGDDLVDTNETKRSTSLWRARFPNPIRLDTVLYGLWPEIDVKRTGTTKKTGTERLGFLMSTLRTKLTTINTWPEMRRSIRFERTRKNGNGFSTRHLGRKSPIT